MPITIEEPKTVKSQGGNWDATPRMLEVTLRIDFTGSKGSMTEGRLRQILGGIMDGAKVAVEAQSHTLKVARIEGEHAFVYGPKFKGRISSPD